MPDKVTIGLVFLLAAGAVNAGADTPRHADRQGDPLPDRAVARLGTVRFRAGDLVYCCAYSPDGKILAAGSADGAIRLFDAAAGKPIRHLRGNQAYITSLAYSPDGKTLASGCAGGDNSINIWELDTGKMLRQFRAPAKQVWSLAFSRDGKGLISGVGDWVGKGEDSLVLLWDPATGKEIRRFTGHRKAVRCVAWSPDGQTIASAGDDARLWDAATGKLVRRLTGQKGPIRSLALSPDGKLLATGSEDNTTWLWEMPTGKVRYRLPKELPKGRPLAVGGIHALAFSPDGKTLATGAADRTLRFWDVATGEKLGEVAGINSVARNGYHDGGIQCIIFSPDGRGLACVQDNRLALLDPQSGQEVLPFQGHGGGVRQAVFVPDGKRLITVSEDPIRQILEWDATSGRLIRQVPVKDPWAHLAAFSPDRKVLATVWDFATLRLWSTTTGKVIRDISLPLPRFSIPYVFTFSPDGRLLAVAGPMGEAAWLIDAGTGKQVRGVEGAGGGPFRVTSLAFSPDGRLLASVGPKTIHLSEVSSGRQRLLIAMPKQHSVYAAAFSPDGRTLATPRLDEAGLPTTTVALWEIATGKERLMLPAPPGQLTCVTFSPDGRLLAAAGWERTVYLWDTAAGKQVGSLEGHQGRVESLAFSPDGRWLASASRDTTALIWDVPRLKAKRPPRPLTKKELEALWSALAGADAVQAYQAILTLERVSEQAVPLLAERLRLRPEPDAERIARLLAQLDGERFADRERAAEELRKLGWAAEPILRKLLKGKPSLEVRKRVRELLDDIRKKEPPPELLRVLRGMEVLEHIGTPQAKRVLQTLAGGTAESRLTREAKASLERLAGKE